MTVMVLLEMKSEEELFCETGLQTVQEITEENFPYNKAILHLQGVVLLIAVHEIKLSLTFSKLQ
jgi:hypothetical protein